LLYQSEVSLSGEEQQQIREIIQKQRASLAEKDDEIVTRAEKN